MNFEENIKNNFSIFFKKAGWKKFKELADYYFSQCANLKVKDFGKFENNRLRIRNIQKRLFVGIGTELLLKSILLKNNFIINKVKDTKKYPNKLIKAIDIQKDEMNISDTISFNNIIENFSKIYGKQEYDKIKNGLLVAKVYRNKEGHMVTREHQYVADEFVQIEVSITLLYKKFFDEDLDFKIAFKKNERPSFKIK